MLYLVVTYHLHARAGNIARYCQQLQSTVQAKELTSYSGSASLGTRSLRFMVTLTSLMGGHRRHAKIFTDVDGPPSSSSVSSLMVTGLQSSLCRKVGCNRSASIEGICTLEYALIELVKMQRVTEYSQCKSIQQTSRSDRACIMLLVDRIANVIAR